MAGLARGAVCAAWLLCVGAVDAQAPKKLPSAVQKEVGEMAKMCREVGGKPAKSPELLTVADLTGDGVPDYVIDQAGFRCDGAASLFSSAGGSQVSAYVGTADGQAFQAFSTAAFGVQIDQGSRPARLQVIVGGPMCGQRVAANTPRAALKSCWRPVDWNAKVRKLQFAPVSQVRWIQ